MKVQNNRWNSMRLSLRRKISSKSSLLNVPHQAWPFSSHFHEKKKEKKERPKKWVNVFELPLQMVLVVGQLSNDFTFLRARDEFKWIFFKMVLLRWREQCTPDTNFPTIFLFGPSGEVRAGRRRKYIDVDVDLKLDSKYTFYKFTRNTRQPEPSSRPRLKPVRASGLNGKSQSWAYT